MTSPRPRIPPGFTATRSFPVVHVDDVPAFDPWTWDLRVQGAVERPLRMTWEEFRALPRVLRQFDFHCVLGWSRLENRWEGVCLRDLLGRARPRADARFVRVADGRRYDAVLPIGEVLASDALLADLHDGRPLEPLHGAPLRLVVPSALGSKSCKWVRTIERLAHERADYWEARMGPAPDPWVAPGSGAPRP